MSMVLRLSRRRTLAALALGATGASALASRGSAACVRACPANVFDAVPGGAPLIARQHDCQTCFLCEIYCPTDALYVAPDAEGPTGVTEAEVEAAGLFGSYARALGWRRGKAGGSDADPTFKIRVAAA